MILQRKWRFCTFLEYRRWDVLHWAQCEIVAQSAIRESLDHGARKRHIWGNFGNDKRDFIQIALQVWYHRTRYIKRKSMPQSVLCTCQQLYLARYISPYQIFHIYFMQQFDSSLASTGRTRFRMMCRPNFTKANIYSQSWTALWTREGRELGNELTLWALGAATIDILR
jgi:hypothetical protein